VPLGLVVRNRSGQELVRTTRASTLVGDLHTDAIVAAALTELLEETASGSTASRTLELHGPPPRSIDLSVTALPSGSSIAVVADVSARQHLVAVRRDFVANVNHELRTPIGALGLLAESLAEEESPDTVRRLANRIAAEAERARLLIEDLLEFSRVEADREPARAVLSVRELVSSALDRLAQRAENQSVALVVAPVPADLHVKGDEEQLTSAIKNLVDNAIKYSEAGQQVDVAARRGPDGVQVEVTDHGVGIPERHLARIFERFYRVDRARDRRTGGTGLGLAIVHHVATNHGGSVTVASREGEGSTFTLHLPEAEAA
jgi:two-component system sensor histidine kinase SenX3